MNETAQKIICNVCTVRNNNDAIWVHIAGAVIPFFKKIPLIVLPRILLHGTVQSYVLTVKTYTHFKRWHWCNFCGHSLLYGAEFTIFPEFLR